jgi:histidinol-phosphate aminotransferase
MAFVDPGDEVVYPWLSFEAYPISVTTMGGIPVTVPLVEEAFDLAAVADAVTERTKLVLLATPNNPTGTAVSTDALGRLLDRIPDDVVVLVDEAYREFADPGLGDPVVDLLPRHPNVVVFRTFSKAYGLAGLRTGYAIAERNAVAYVRFTSSNPNDFGITGRERDVADGECPLALENGRPPDAAVGSFP